MDIDDTRGIIVWSLMYAVMMLGLLCLVLRPLYGLGVMGRDRREIGVAISVRGGGRRGVGGLGGEARGLGTPTLYAEGETRQSQ